MEAFADTGDEKLVEIAQGEADYANDAFDELIRRFRDKVYGLCFSYMRNQTDAEDLVQEVFIRAFRGLKKFEGRSKFGTWIYRIATNACLNLIRDRKRRPSTIPLEEALIPAPPTPQADPFHERLKLELSRALTKAVERLPQRQQQTFRLRYYAQLSVKDTAEAMGVEPGTIKAHYFTALRHIRRYLEDELGEEKLQYILD